MEGFLKEGDYLTSRPRYVYRDVKQPSCLMRERNENTLTLEILPSPQLTEKLMSGQSILAEPILSGAAFRIPTPQFLALVMPMKMLTRIFATRCFQA
jgi:hypothetical protein